ncbi:alpha-ketoglutarate-dependent dioxygenase AlkB [Kangiella marina]|uniref:Alpha-ketoglutarate-dependent dioxygenase AlkB n=1 Tax=Kangiella marina TaxID=1079178 RepID=A0ABP8IML9_9GAMM
MQQFGLGFGQEIETLALGAHQSDEQSNDAVQFQPNFIEDDDAIAVFKALSQQIEWRQESLWIAGKERQVPRLVAWYGDTEAEYRYSGKLHTPIPWIRPLAMLKERIEAEVGSDFNSVLCNLYRDGKDSMGWHADDEKELGKDPVIASLSLGQERSFHLKHKTVPKLKHKMTLTSGSLLVMKGTTQQNWLHQVPKETHITQPRINLTFRKIMT